VVDPAATRSRLLQGLILAMAGLVASLGVTLGCMIRNILMWPEGFAHNFTREPNAGDMHGHLRGTGLADMALVLVFALLMLVWVWGVVRFVRRDSRSPLTWALAAGIVSIFAWACWRNWLLAYPVCNPM
jgi:hypothetical protein